MKKTSFSKYIAFFVSAILICFILPDKQAVAQTSNNGVVDTLLFRDMQFRGVGPTRGGRVTAVEGVPKASNVFYMGVAPAGGVWRSNDYGRSWYNITDGKGYECTDIGAIAVAPSDTSVIYVGTGSLSIRDLVLTGCGVYKSTDSGKHWTFIGLKNAGQIGAIRVDPNDPDRVFVAALGHVFGKNKQRGIFRSTNGGQSWDKVLYASDSTGAADVELNPANPDIVYAAMWRGERKPWNIISGGSKGDGLYKSIDGGTNWKRLTDGLPKGLVGKADIAVTAANPDLLYALIEASGDSTGLYRSEDGGEHWQFINDKSGLMARPFYFTHLHVDPTNGDVIYVGAVRNWVSKDGGKTFKTRRVTHSDIQALWINPNDSRIQIQGNDGGASVTLDGGKSWSTLYNQPTAEIWQVDVDNQFPYRIYGGQQDESSMVVPSLPTNNNNPIGFIRDWESVGGCETGPSVPAPDSPNIVYSNCKGRFGIFNRITGREKNYYIGAASMYGFNPKDLKFRFARSAPIEVSPNNPHIIYMGSQYLHRSINGGQTWHKISPDLTAFKPQFQITAGVPITRDVTGEENFSTLNSIQVSPHKRGVIWTGANDGPVYLTQNGGETWANVTPEDAPENARVEAIEISPEKAGKVYVAITKRLQDDFHPYIFRTTDYGKHWTLLTNGKNGIPANYPTRVVREDPVIPGLLYAGTDRGLFISFDDGRYWQPLKQGLPNTTVSDIIIKANDLVLSTYGRGFWILDDLSVFRQLGNVNSGSNYLYDPIPAYRMRYSTRGGGGSVSKDPSNVPHYPRPGATIDFYLAAGAKTPVVLQIKDGNGKPVQTYIGRFKEEKGDKKCSSLAQELSVAPTAQCFTVHPGHNRFRWNMRYPGKTIKATEGNTYYGVYRGPLVIPGLYGIQLSAGNWKGNQTLRIKMDPRERKAGVTQNDLQAQLKLNMKIRDLIGHARKLSADVDSMRADLKAKMKKSKRKKYRQKLEKLNGLHRQLVTNNDVAYPPVMFIDQAQYLYRMDSSTDQRPGNDAYARYKELRKKIKKLQAKWKKLN